MNSRFLGDEIDHWKGSLILTLTEKRLISKVAVDPMVTDRQPWSQENLQAYGRLLHLGQNMICHADVTFSGRRRDYFAGIQHNRDLFLDPDTGISIDRQVHRKHIKVSEICNLLNGHVNHNRVLMIYQHSPRRPFHEQLAQIGDALLNYNQENRWYCIYEGRQVAMFFVSRNQKRIQRIQDCLRLYINDRERERVWGNGHIA